MSGCGRRVIGMVVVALMALIASGCGGASSTSSTSRSTKTSTAGTTTTASAASRPAPSTNGIPAGSVAVVAGTPVTQATFNHWMYVAAKSQTSQTPGTPLIVPDPPDFTNCVAQVRAKIPSFKSKSTKSIAADCHQLFVSLSSQVMDYLIRADWMQADGARHGIVPTAAQVDRALNTAKNKQFPTEASFQSFLAKTGQTLEDVRFRFRINLIDTQLAAREKGSTTAKATAVSKREKQLFAGRTRCAALELMNDCGNYRAG